MTESNAKQHTSIIPPKEKTNLIAQKLYDYYRTNNLNNQQWLDCLIQLINDSNASTNSKHELKNKIIKIIEDDKRIPLSHLSPYQKDEIYREISEWLAAEAIAKQWYTYEKEVSEGLESGKYKRIHSIDEIVIIQNDKSTPVFNNGKEQEIRETLLNNYVLEVNGKPLGSGARVDVVEFKPTTFPMPTPRKSEFKDGLYIKIPNQHLVMRILRESYRTSLGSSENIDTSEKAAITTLTEASTYFIQPTSRNARETITTTTREVIEKSLKDNNILREELSYIDNSKKEKSFIPPLMIVKLKRSENAPSEYVTIQKRINAQGSTDEDPTKLLESLKAIKGFKNNLNQFIQCCKKLYKKGKLPDLVGRRNVLYTKQGYVYLVDINNITSRPDFKTIAELCLIEDINFAITRLENQQNTTNNPQKKYEIENKLKNLKEEKQTIIEIVRSKHPTLQEKWNDAIQDLHYSKSKELLQDLNLLDDLKTPMFLNNIEELYRLEQLILQSSYENKEITEEEYKEKLQKLEEEEMYKVLFPYRQSWREKRSFDTFDILENKNQGKTQWISFYIKNLHGRLNHMYKND